ncbi:hypothetical protein [Burkholderia gladioli]|uniref:hypothetical protein n=1 Tax=Burkholderia gladioli TaxID=28095 RepID=UPI00163E7F15|nr:hypothetical protein [Burkholderia gladioli]
MQKAKKTRKPKVDESTVRYRTLKESWNMEKIWPLLQKRIIDPEGENTDGEIGRLARETIGPEIELAEKLAELFLSKESTAGDFARLISERGISATSLSFCSTILQGGDVGELYENLLRERQRSASRARYLKDPKQLAKAEVKKLWELWRLDASRYPSKAAFARDMVEKFDELKSSKKIEDWTREWERGTP